MFFHSSHGIRSVIWSTCLIFVMAVAVSAQSPETVLAKIRNIEITQKQVDDSIATQIYPLQQQLYAIRKAALENLITRRILAREAAGRCVSVEELRKHVTCGEINVTGSQVEEAYKQNASFFASMSPDEARERLRLDLESQARMKNYRAGLDALRKKWTVRIDF